MGPADRATDPGAPRSVGPWGPATTIAWGILLFGINSASQVLGLLPGVAAFWAMGLSSDQIHEWATSGLNFSLALLVACPVTVLGCGLFAALRRGPTLTDYFAVKPVSGRTLAAWVVLQAGLSVGISVLNHWLDEPVPEVMVDMMSTAVYLPLLWAAVGVAGPLTEEVFMRGFLYAGLERGPGGRWMAVGVTSVAFALLHAGQYGWFAVAQVGLLGLAFGMARALTGSILVPVVMHIFNNLMALALFDGKG